MYQEHVTAVKTVEKLWQALVCFPSRVQFSTKIYSPLGSLFFNAVTALLI